MRFKIARSFTYRSLEKPSLVSLILNSGRAQLIFTALDEDSGGKYPIDDDWNSSSENESCNLGYGSDWDTDDEVEEANMTDDMFKILEGDWS